MTVQPLHGDHASAREKEARAYRLCVALLYPVCLAEAVGMRVLALGSARSGDGRTGRQPARSVFEDARARVHEIAPYVFVR
ncbi:MAG: hypothetical protein AAGJ70_08090 [Pseudomonadota bacterium]